MTVEIRPATAEEMGEMGILGGYVYGGSFGDGPENVIATANLPDWTLCAFVDGKLASMFSDIPFTMRANGQRREARRRLHDRHAAGASTPGAGAADSHPGLRRHARGGAERRRRCGHRRRRSTSATATR